METHMETKQYCKTCKGVLLAGLFGSRVDESWTVAAHCPNCPQNGLRLLSENIYSFEKGQRMVKDLNKEWFDDEE